MHSHIHHPQDVPAIHREDGSTLEDLARNYARKMSCLSSPQAKDFKDKPSFGDTSDCRLAEKVDNLKSPCQMISGTNVLHNKDNQNSTHGFVGWDSVIQNEGNINSNSIYAHIVNNRMSVGLSPSYTNPNEYHSLPCTVPPMYIPPQSSMGCCNPQCTAGHSSSMVSGEWQHQAFINMDCRGSARLPDDSRMKNYQSHRRAHSVEAWRWPRDRESWHEGQIHKFGHDHLGFYPVPFSNEAITMDSNYGKKSKSGYQARASFSRKDSFKREQANIQNSRSSKTYDSLKRNSPKADNENRRNKQEYKLSRAASTSCMPNNQCLMYDTVINELKGCVKQDSSTMETPNSPFEKTYLSGLEEYDHSPNHSYNLHKQSNFSYSTSSLPHRRNSKNKKKKEGSLSHPVKCRSLDEDKLASISGSDEALRIEYGLEDNQDISHELSSHVRPSELHLHQFFSLPYTSAKVAPSPSGNIPVPVQSAQKIRQNSEEKPWGHSRPKKNASSNSPRNPGRTPPQRQSSCTSLCDKSLELARDMSHKDGPTMSRSESLRLTSRPSSGSFSTPRECAKSACMHGTMPRQSRGMAFRYDSCDKNMEVSDLSSSYIMSRISGAYPKEASINKESNVSVIDDKHHRSHPSLNEMFIRKPEWSCPYLDKNKRRDGSSGRREAGSKDVGRETEVRGCMGGNWMFPNPKPEETKSWQMPRKASVKSSSKNEPWPSQQDPTLQQQAKHNQQQHKRRSRPKSLYSWTGSCDGISSATDHSGKTVISARSRSLCTDSLVTPARDVPNSAADVYRFSQSPQEPRMRSDSLEARWSSDNSLEDHPTDRRQPNTYYDSLYSEISSESSVYGTPQPRETPHDCLLPKEDRGILSDDEASVDLDATPRQRRNVTPRRRKSQGSRSNEDASRVGERSALTPPPLNLSSSYRPGIPPKAVSPASGSSNGDWFQPADVSRTVGALADSLTTYQANLV